MVKSNFIFVSCFCPFLKKRIKAKVITNYNQKSSFFYYTVQLLKTNTKQLLKNHASDLVVLKQTKKSLGKNNLSSSLLKIAFWSKFTAPNSPPVLHDLYVYNGKIEIAQFHIRK